jgi:hypothetical protein
VDDWENADVDKLAENIVTKAVQPASAGGKAIRVDKEEEDEEEK